MTRPAAAAGKIGNSLIIVMIWVLSSPVWTPGADARLPTLTKNIPERPRSALTGSQFVDLVAKMDEQQREHAILEQLLEGNLPDFLRKLKPVNLQTRLNSGRLVHATVFVTPDYLAIGSQADFIRIPMNYHTATAVAARYGFVLPTRKIVDAIYQQSAYHFTPQPMTPGPKMRSTTYYQNHNRKIAQERVAHNIPLGALVAGHKKDVVITNRLALKPNRIAIYGWQKPDGIPIQPLSTVHGAGYADYSHGIRLVSDVALIDGKVCSIFDVLQDPQIASVLSEEGPIDHLPNILEVPALTANLRLAPANH